MAVIRRAKSSNIKKNIEISYDLNQAISILQMHGNKKIERTRKLTIKTVDEFLLSGKFNKHYARFESIDKGHA